MVCDVDDALAALRPEPADVGICRQRLRRGVTPDRHQARSAARAARAASPRPGFQYVPTGATIVSMCCSSLPDSFSLDLTASRLSTSTGIFARTAASLIKVS